MKYTPTGDTFYVGAYGQLSFIKTKLCCDSQFRIGIPGRLKIYIQIRTEVIVVWSVEPLMQGPLVQVSVLSDIPKLQADSIIYL